MSEQLHVCKALAAMLREHGEPTEEEVRFVGLAALELGLAPDENSEVQRVLKEGDDYRTLIGEVTSRPMRRYLFRRVVAASLLDEQITEKETLFIDQTAEAFGYEAAAVDEFIAWMREGIAWEKRGTQLMSRL